MKILHLNLKGVYFDAIKDGSKKTEYREFNDFWKKRLTKEGRPINYDQIILKRGYPSKEDASKHIIKKWKGFTITAINHPFFNGKTNVFAIDVS